MKKTLLIASLFNIFAISYAEIQVQTEQFIYEDANHLVRETVNNSILGNDEKDARQIITIDSITLSGKNAQNQVCRETLHSDIKNQDLIEFYQTGKNNQVQNFLCNSSLSLNFCTFSINTSDATDVLIGQLPLTNTYIQPTLDISQSINVNNCIIDKTTEAIVLQIVN